PAQRRCIHPFPTRRSSDLVERYSLMIKQMGPLPIVTRLGKNGPILAVVNARGFLFWSSTQTYLQVIETTAAGSSIIEMMMVLSPDRKSTRLNSSHVSISYA